MSKKLLHILKQIHATRKRPHTGICAMIIDVGKGYAELTEFKALATAWPKYSGNRTYPVPTPAGRTPSSYFASRSNLWDRTTAYGALRWELLEWCIAALEANYA